MELIVSWLLSEIATLIFGVASVIFALLAYRGSVKSQQLAMRVNHVDNEAKTARQRLLELELEYVSKKSKDFSLTEYESLRKELADNVASTRKLEQYCAVSSAAIWSWILVQSPDKAWIVLIKWLPLVLCLFGAVRCLALLISIIGIAGYIKKVEKFWGSENNCFFWEQYIEKNRWHLTATAALIWLVLIAGNFYLACEIKPEWFGIKDKN